MHTHCNKCIFAKIENEQQSGCCLGRDEKLGINSKDDSGYYILDRFCTTHRDESWLSSLTLDEIENKENVVLEEVFPRIGFLIILDINTKDPIKDLEVTLNDIRLQTKRSPRYVVVVTPKVEYNEETFSLINKYLEKDTLRHIVRLNVDYDNKLFIIDEAFRYAMNGWLYVTTSGERVKHDLLEVLDRKINIDMKVVSIITPYDDFNGFLFQTSLFKYLNGNRCRKIDQDEYDDRMFLDKARDMDKNNSIITWEDIYAT